MDPREVGFWAVWVWCGQVSGRGVGVVGGWWASIFTSAIFRF